MTKKERRKEKKTMTEQKETGEEKASTTKDTKNRPGERRKASDVRTSKEVEDEIDLIVPGADAPPSRLLLPCSPLFVAPLFSDSTP